MDGMSLGSHTDLNKIKKKDKEHTQNTDVGRKSDEEELRGELVRLLPAPWVSKES